MSRSSALMRTCKEVARHLLHRLGVKRRLAHLEPKDRADRFSKIYADGVWQHGDSTVPSSGSGSSLGATATLQQELPSLLDSLGAMVMLDVGCGDFTWMRAAPIRQSYIGVDLVPSVIEDNKRRYGAEQRTFVLCDAVEGDLPEADVVFCREVLFHLSFADVKELLQNLLSKPREYLILTSDASTLFNSDIQSGDFRALNLERAPFRLPRPTKVIRDDSVAFGRTMGVWRAKEVASALNPPLAARQRALRAS